MDKLNTILLDSSLAIEDQDTSTIEAFSTYHNYLRVIAPRGYDWVPYAIFKANNASDDVGIPTEYLVLNQAGTTTHNDETYYVYECDFPAAVVGSARATKIEITAAFISNDNDVIGVSLYDETEEGYNDTTYIAAQLLLDYTSAVNGDIVRVFNTDTDWQFNGTAWIDQDEYLISEIPEHRSETVEYTLRKGLSTSRPTHAPNNTETIISQLSNKINRSEVIAGYYTQTELDNLLSVALALKVNKTTTIAGVDLQNDITKSEMKVALDIDDAEGRLTTNEADIVILDNRLDDYDTANVLKSVTLNTSTYVLTFTNYDDTTTTFDLPTESAIVNIEYVEADKDLVFTLQNGTETVVPLDAIISGLATETYVGTSIATALTDYYDNTEVYTKDEIDTELADKLDKDFSTLTVVSLANEDSVAVFDYSGNLLGRTTLNILASYILAEQGTFGPNAIYDAETTGGAGLTAELAQRANSMKAWALTKNADGEYYVDTGTHTLTSGNIYYFLIPEATETDALTISLDGSTGTYLSVKNNGINVPTNNFSNSLLTVKYDGTNFITLKNGTITQNISFNEAIGTFDTGATGVSTGVQDKYPAPMTQYKGRTLAQPTIDGEFDDDNADGAWANIGITDATYSGGISSSVASGASSLMVQNISGTSGDKWLVKAKLMKNSGSGASIYVLPHGATSGAIGELWDPTAFDALDTGVWYETSIVVTATNAGIRLAYGRGSAQTFDFDLDYFYAIPLPDDITTVAEAEALLDGTYFEGLSWVGKSRTYAPSDYDSGFQDYIENTLGIASGEALQGVITKTSDGTKDYYHHMPYELQRIGDVYDDIDTQRISNESGVAIGATINTTLINTMSGTSDFIAVDETNGEVQQGVYGDTLALTNTATVYYELATYLPRTEANNNLLQSNGQLYIGEAHTYEQSSNGVVGKFYADIASNSEALAKVGNDIDVDQQKQINGALKRIDSLEDITTPATDDLRFPLTRSLQGVLNKPDYDYTNLGMLFPQNDTDEIAYIVAQMPHSWQEGSTIYPHVHMVQTQDLQAVFKIDYKIYDIGDTIPATWTTLTMDSYMITYTSGSIGQLLTNTTGIDMTGYTSSAVIKIKLYRDDNVYTGDVLVDEFDIHYTKDKFGKDVM